MWKHTHSQLRCFFVVFCFFFCFFCCNSIICLQSDLPSEEWQSLWGQNYEYPMWAFARAQHPHVAAHISLLLRVVTAIFCQRDTFARSVSAHGAIVRASDGGLPRMLSAADEQVLRHLSAMLHNPYLKISLPVAYWKVGMLTFTSYTHLYLCVRNVA